MTGRPMVLDDTGGAEPLLFQPLADSYARGEENEESKRRETERRLELARAEGYARGTADGMQQATAALEQPIAAVREAVRLLAEARAQLPGKVIPDLVRLCLTVATKVAGAELRARPEAIESLLSDLLEEASDKTIASLHLHPDDLQALHDSSIVEALNEADVRIVPDPSLTRGGSVLETNNGILDARVETRIEVLCERLMESANRE